MNEEVPPPPETPEVSEDTSREAVEKAAIEVGDKDISEKFSESGESTESNIDEGEELSEKEGEEKVGESSVSEGTKEKFSKQENDEKLEKLENEGDKRVKDIGKIVDDLDKEGSLDNFQKDKWDNLTLEQKKDNLQKVADNFSENYGLDKFDIKSTHTQDKDLYGEQRGKEIDFKRWDGLSTRDEQLAGANLDGLKEKMPEKHEGYNLRESPDFDYQLQDPMEALDTVAHEVEHARQREAGVDMSNYINPKESGELYQKQPIETDANNYAEIFKQELAKKGLG